MGRKIEVQETANKTFNICQAIFAPPSSGAHGTCHTCHILDHGLWKGPGRPLPSWILKFSAKKAIFLVSRRKKQILPLLASPRKILKKSPNSPPGKILPTPIA